MDSNLNDYSILPSDRAELLRRIAHEWATLERVIDSLSDEQMSVPDEGEWSIKDNLAHLTAWEEFMRLHHLQGLPPHKALDMDEGAYGQGDENELNEILLQRYQDRTLSEVLDALRSTHEQVIADLEQISPAALKEQHYDDDSEARPLMCWIVYNTYEHYREHSIHIERLVQQAGE